MLYKEYRQIIIVEGAIRPDPSLAVRSWKGTCTVDGLFPLPVVAASSTMPRPAVIDIVDQHQQPIGMLLTCRGVDFGIGKFGAAHLAAYLFEIRPDQYAQPGAFGSDYVAVRKDRLKEYKGSFEDSSAIWGGFWHTEASASSPSPPMLHPIAAYPGIKLPTGLHIAAARRSAILPFALERYLKLYHLLELSFDYDTVLRIKALGDDLHGIGKILSQHKWDEFDRLKQLIIDKCADPSAVAKCIEEICTDRKWDGTMDSIFFHFGKDGNPLLKKHVEFKEMVSVYGFTKKGAVDSDVLSQKETDKGVFDTLVLKVAAYWIYRVRCCIAHSRIGEYVLKPEDEEFVEKFAEKLLRRVLMTVLH